MVEEWKKIKNFENYKVSNKGEIINVLRKKQIKQFIGKDGYVRIYLYKNGKKKAFLLHQIVAKHFINNNNNYIEINHKDENKQNNNVNNLEWCNRKYNCNYGTMQIRKSQNLLKAINQYDLNGNFIKKWQSIKEAGEKLKIHKGNISWCCKGIYKSTKGFIFKYVEEA